MSTEVIINPPDQILVSAISSNEYNIVVTTQSAIQVSVSPQSGSIGLNGNAATINVGTVLGGTTASVINSGTSSEAVFDFILPAGPGIIDGGAVNQVLTKKSNGSYDTEWRDPAAGVASDTVANETAFGLIPTAGSAFSYARGDHTHGSQPYPIGGVDKQIQFNDAGIHGGDSQLTWDKDTKALKIGNGTSALPNNPLNIEKSVNGYLQVNIKNDDAGANSSSDYVVTADNGSDTTHYLDMGKNSSTYDSVDYPLYNANDGYLFDADDDLVIGAPGTGKKVKFHAGGFELTDLAFDADSEGINLYAGKTIRINGNDIRQFDHDRNSAGLVSGGTLSTGTPNTTVSVANGIGWAWNGAEYVRVIWSDFLNQVVTDTQYNYIAIYYDGTLNISTTEQTGNSYIRLGHIFKNVTTGIITTIWGTPENIGDYQHKNNEFVNDVFGTIIANGFLVTEQANPNYLKLSISAGELYARLSPFTYGVKTSFLKLMNTTDKGITVDFMNNNSTIDTTVWCDPTKAYASALTTMTLDYWAMGMVIASIGGGIYYVYPQAEYATSDLAKAAILPSAAQLVADGNALLATIVFKKSDTTIANRISDIRPIMSRAFGTPTELAGGSVIDHGSLTGLADDDHAQYQTTGRADTWLAGKSTTNLSEGTKLYYTTARSIIAAGGMVKNSIVYNATAGTIMLSGDEASPSVSKYYGTDSGSNLGYHALPVSPEPGASKSFAIAMAIGLG
jgi:hypothetical protein